MSKRKVYLSGAMSGVDKADSKAWRYMLEQALDEFKCFDPWDHFSFDNDDIDDVEAMEYDLWNLRNSDIVIVNFDYNPASLGTMSELAIAYDRRIPIIGVNETFDELHPWQTAFCTRVFADMNDLVNYVKEHYT